MPRPAPRHGGGKAVGDQLGGRGVDLIDDHTIGAEIRHERESTVW
jgi:hypothetical protein